jgi:Domain of unknown function (DUF5615)
VAEFYLDHNVAAAIAGHLRAAGHGALTADELGLAGARDHRHLLEAAQRGRVFVTYNWDDFRLLHDAWVEWPPAWGVEPRPQHAGVVVIPQPDPRRGSWLAPDAAAHLAAFVDGVPPLANALYRWFPRDGWVRF